jgi:Tol biopolymer transport system component
MTRIAALLLAAAAVLGAAVPAHATFPGSNGRVAAAARGDVFRAIISLPPMGSGRGRNVRFVRDCQLSESGEPDSGDCSIRYSSPSWAPGGRRLAFDSGAAIALVNSDRSGYRRLGAVTSDDGEPAYAPKGSALAFTGRTGSRRDLYVRRSSGAVGKPIARRAASPDWSSRNRIAFVRRGTIHTVTPTGGGLRRIARGSAPSWSPSGRSIAFARGGGIYVVRADGGGRRRVMRCSGCRTPVFSPNGRMLVYKKNGLVVARASDGKRLRTIIEDVRGGFDASEPSWQPRI